MGFVALFFAFLLGMLTIGFEHVQLTALHQRVAVEQQAVLHTSLDAASGYVVQQINAQIAAGTSPAGPFTVPDAALPVCSGVNTNDALCADTIAIHTVFVGSTGIPANTAAIQPLPNLNAATSASNQVIQGAATFALTLTLQSPTGATLASRTGSLNISTFDAPPNYAVFNAFVDANGSAGSAQALPAAGQCDPTDPRCTAVTNDSGLDSQATTAGGAGATDTRVHAQLVCNDPGAHSQHAGDLCAPTGNPTATPQPDDAFANSTISAPSQGWGP